MDTLLTPAGAAEQLGVAVSTLVRWRRERKGPDFIRLGHRSVRYQQSDVDAWIQRRPRITTEE